MVIILIVSVSNILLIFLAAYIDSYIWRVNYCIRK